MSLTLTPAQTARLVKTFRTRQVKDQTPGTFTSRGQDDANFAAMRRTAVKLGFSDQQWYVDCSNFCKSFASGEEQPAPVAPHMGFSCNCWQS